MVVVLLGVKGIFGFDFLVGCVGFGYVFGVVVDMIWGGGVVMMLVVGMEKLFFMIDMYDCGNCFIFVDGVVVVVVGEILF